MRGRRWGPGVAAALHASPTAAAWALCAFMLLISPCLTQPCPRHTHLDLPHRSIHIPFNTACKLGGLIIKSTKALEQVGWRGLRPTACCPCMPGWVLRTGAPPPPARRTAAPSPPPDAPP